MFLMNKKESRKKDAADEDFAGIKGSRSQARGEERPITGKDSHEDEQDPEASQPLHL